MKKEIFNILNNVADYGNFHYVIVKDGYYHVTDWAYISYKNRNIDVKLINEDKEDGFYTLNKQTKRLNIYHCGYNSSLSYPGSMIEIEEKELIKHEIVLRFTPEQIDIAMSTVNERFIVLFHHESELIVCSSGAEMTIEPIVFKWENGSDIRLPNYSVFLSTYKKLFKLNYFESDSIKTFVYTDKNNQPMYLEFNSEKAVLTIKLDNEKYIKDKIKYAIKDSSFSSKPNNIIIHSSITDDLRDVFKRYLDYNNVGFMVENNRIVIYLLKTIVKDKFEGGLLKNNQLVEYESIKIITNSVSNIDIEKKLKKSNVIKTSFLTHALGKYKNESLYMTSDSYFTIKNRYLFCGLTYTIDDETVMDIIEEIDLSSVNI